MRPSNYLLWVAAGLGACNLASAQAPSALLKQLLKAQDAAMNARLRAVVRASNDAADEVAPGVPTPPTAAPAPVARPRDHTLVVRLLFEWAYAAGKEHVKLLPGSHNGLGRETDWDGKRFMERSPHDPYSSATTYASIRVSADKNSGSLYPNPIKYGYGALIGGTKPAWLWTVEIAKAAGVRVETGSDGRVRLYLPRSLAVSLAGASRMIELNPRWGYMIDLDREDEMRPPNRGGGKPKSVALHEMKVLSAQNIGGCWIPTRIVERFVTPPRPGFDGLLRAGVEVSDVSTHVADSEFAPLGRPGDTVLDGKRKYVIDRNGKWQIVKRAEPQRVMSTAKLAIAAALTILVVVLFLILRGRRRPVEYWGPPGQEPKS